MLDLRYPNTMGYWSRNRVRASPKCSRVEGRSYAPMNRVRFPLVTNLHLTTFNPWKRVESKLHTWGRPRKTRHTPSCAPPAAVMLINKHIMSYHILLQQYSWLVILVSVCIICSDPPICTAQIVCVIPELRPSQMLRIPRGSPRGSGFHQVPLCSLSSGNIPSVVS